MVSFGLKTYLLLINKQPAGTPEIAKQDRVHQAPFCGSASQPCTHARNAMQAAIISCMLPTMPFWLPIIPCKLPTVSGKLSTMQVQP